MIRRSTWIMLAAFVALLAIAYGVTRYKHHETAAEAQTAVPTPHLLADFSLDDVLEVVIRGQGKEVVLQRPDPNGAWRVLSPTPGPNELVDTTRLDTALYNLTALSAQNQVPNGTDLTLLGVDNPRYQIEVHLENGKTWRLDIGKTTPVQTGYYARLGERLVVVDKYSVDGLTALLDKPPLVTPVPTPPLPPPPRPRPPPRPPPRPKRPPPEGSLFRGMAWRRAPEVFPSPCLPPPAPSKANY